MKKYDLFKNTTDNLITIQKLSQEKFLYYGKTSTWDDIFEDRGIPTDESKLAIYKYLITQGHLSHINYDESGFDILGFDRDGLDKYGFDRNGFDRKGFNKQGYDRNGYDRNGFSKSNFNRQSIHRNGTPFDDDGYLVTGFNRDGYDREGYNRGGFNMDGIDREGFDKHGFNKDGYDREGFHLDGYNKEGFDRDGYDREGYNLVGFNRSGYDKQGYNEQGEYKSFMDNYFDEHNIAVSQSSKERIYTEEIKDILLDLSQVGTQILLDFKSTALAKLRTAVELYTKEMLKRQGFTKQIYSIQQERNEFLKERSLVSLDEYKLLEEIRTKGNDSTHEFNHKLNFSIADVKDLYKQAEVYISKWIKNL